MHEILPSVEIVSLSGKPVDLCLRFFDSMSDPSFGRGDIADFRIGKDTGLSGVICLVLMLVVDGMST